MDTAGERTDSGDDYETEVGPLHAIELAGVARRYYLEGRSKVEIADDLEVSRFRVARMLDEARRAGIVRIEVNASPHVDIDLSEAVRARFGLEQAVVATTSDVDSAGGRTAVASVAAALLAELIDADDVVGIGGGATLSSVIDHLPALPACSAVQLLGGVPGTAIWANSVDLVRRVAEKTGGPMSTFLLPFLVEDASTAEKLRSDRQYSAARSMYPLLDLAVTAIGSWDPPRSGVHDLLDDRAQRSLRRRGVAADVLGVLVDHAGEVVETDLSERSTGISLAEIQQIPRVVAVAWGPERGRAVASTLRSGLVSTLVTDRSIAKALLNENFIDSP